MAVSNNQPLAVIPQTAEIEAKAADPVLQQAMAFAIHNREHFQAAAVFLRSIKSRIGTLEGMRTSVGRPLLEAKRTVDEWFAAPLAVLRRAESQVKDLMGAFERLERDRIELERREAEARARQEREELERRASRAADKGQVEKAADLTARAREVVAAPPETAPLKARGMSFGELWSFVVVDPALVPREYLMVDESKISGVVRSMKGDTKIPGISVFSRPLVGARGER